MTEMFLSSTQEPLFNMEVQSSKVPRHGIRYLSIFCETLKLDEKLVNKAIRNARKNGYVSCTYGEWTFSWMSIDTWRDFLENYNVNINIRMNRIHGYMPKNISDFPKGFKSFAKKYEELMNDNN